METQQPRLCSEWMPCLAIVLTGFVIGRLTPNALGGEVYICWKVHEYDLLCLDCVGWNCNPECNGTIMLCWTTIVDQEPVTEGDYIFEEELHSCWTIWECNHNCVAVGNGDWSTSASGPRYYRVPGCHWPDPG